MEFFLCVTPDVWPAAIDEMLPFSAGAATLLAATAAAAPVDLARFVPAIVVGLGRYGSSPALFLQDAAERGVGDVLPVPVPSDAVVAIEQALSLSPTSVSEVLLQSQAVVQRDGGLFDSLPWAWAPSPQAKRDAFARATGRAYPREGYQSVYHLLLDMVRRDCCADVVDVVIENTALLGSLVLGGALLVERRLPPSRDSGSYSIGSGPAAAPDARWCGEGAASAEPLLCECSADEALGLAVALGGGVCTCHMHMPHAHATCTCHMQAMALGGRVLVEQRVCICIRTHTMCIRTHAICTRTQAACSSSSACGRWAALLPVTARSEARCGSRCSREGHRPTRAAVEATGTGCRAQEASRAAVEATGTLRGCDGRRHCPGR